MPTFRKDKNVWLARVFLNGKQVSTRTFPPGKKGGPEWRRAKEWEEQELQKILMGPVSEILIRSDLERLLGWGNQYLAHVKRTMSTDVFKEKKRVMMEFFSFCREEKIERLEDISRAAAYRFLSDKADAAGANISNRFRKNLLAAWNWGADFLDEFPQVAPPFKAVRPFPVLRQDRYVPPEEDVVRVLQFARGQDLVMLLTLYFTGARRGEVFRLSWARDIRLDTGQIRLSDNKDGSGTQRHRWLSLHPELHKVLAWWHDARPIKVDNVFFQDHCDVALGEPYKERRHFMARICQRAGVKPFGFHAIRHKSAAITFVSGGLTAAQILMGHYRATTTDIYVKSSGLYADQSVIHKALGQSRIGKAAKGLVQKRMPLELTPPEAQCQPDIVNHNIH